MKRHLLKGLLATYALTAYPQTIPNVDWTRYYSEKSQISNVPSAIDGNNNAYITGYTYPNSPFNKDATTIKYDALGVIAWVKNYDNGGADNAKCIALDNQGNVIIAGESDGVGTGRDIFVIKYDAGTGIALWTKRFNGVANGSESANAMVVDANGEVYVTGFTTNINGNKDIITLKYDANGNQKFATITAGTSGLDDEGTAIAINNNRLYVTSVANNTANTSSNIITVRLNPNNGNTVWSKTETGTAIGGYNAGYALLAYNNDVVLVGVVNNSISGNDYITCYYNGNNGTIAWKKIYDGNTTDDAATAITQDASGRIVITGISKNSTTFEYHTIMYNSNGVQQWINKEKTNLANPSVQPQIVCDALANHFYVSGQVLGTQSDMYVYQITPSGRTSWSENVNGAQNGLDAAVDLVVNNQGVVYLAGASLNSNAKFDYTTVKISQTPVYFPLDPTNEPPSEPRAYTENAGQLSDVFGNVVPKQTVKYYTEYANPAFFINNKGFSFAFTKSDTIAATPDSIHKINVNFIKANELSKAYAFEPYVSEKNYFLPNLTSPITEVKSNKRIMIPNIYPNIDLHFYSNTSGMKYYFVIKPSGNPNAILQQFEGAISSSIVGTDLIVNTACGSLKLRKANAYQIISATNTMPVSFQANWLNSGLNTFKFNIGAYNTALPLVLEIDESAAPNSSTAADNMVWNTYVGGERNDEFLDMKLDNNGNSYVLQETQSQTFFTAQNTVFGFAPLLNNYGAQIYKFDKYGVKIKQTYIGSTTGVNPVAISVLSDSSIVFAGKSTASVVPVGTIPNVANAYTVTTGNWFLLKFGNTNINSVSWSTRYNGTILDVDVNSTDDIYIIATAATTGTNSPLVLSKPNATNINGSSLLGTSANIVTRFDATGVPKWASYIPVRSGSLKTTIKIDKARNNFYVVGALSDTTDFKHYNTYGTFIQNTKKSFRDGYIQKFNSNDSLIASTFYGGTNDDDLNDVEILTNGDVCVIGNTASNDKPSVTFNPNNGSYFNATGSGASYSRGWITKFDSLMNRKWAITYGDSLKTTQLNVITKDNNENIYIGGFSNGIPIFNGLINPFIQNAASSFNACFLMFSKTNDRYWATLMGTPAIQMSGTKGLNYNSINNCLVFSGGAGTGAGTGTNSYPFRNFTNPQAYWQNFVYNSSFGYTESFVGRFSLTGVIGIEEYSKSSIKSNLLIYPNPTTNSVNFVMDAFVSKPYQLNVYNAMGQIVYKEIIKDFYNDTHTLNLEHLASGVYFLQASSSELNKSAKLIKE